MLGLIVLPIVVLYFVLLFKATRGGYRWAKMQGASKAKCWAAAAVGFLVVYLPVFWDWIPTLVANKYYCATQAGFTVYKTVEQWKAENPSVAQTLTWREVPNDVVLPDGTRRTLWNQRFVTDSRKEKPIPLLSTTLHEDFIRDAETGEVLAKHVMVGSGYGSSMVGGPDWRVHKSWLKQGRCYPMRGDFIDFEKAVWRMGAKE